MSQKQNNLIVALDIGSAHTRVLAAELNEGSLRYRGHGVVDSAGMRKAMIGDLSAATAASTLTSAPSPSAVRTCAGSTPPAALTWAAA